MRKLTWMLCCFPMQVVFAAIPAVVPFLLPITLQPGDTINAFYTFGNRPGIYCYDNTMQINPAVATMTWLYNGSVFSGALSALPLVLDNVSFTGNLADFSGVINILNITNVPLVVDCQYTF